MKLIGDKPYTVSDINAFIKNAYTTVYADGLTSMLYYMDENYICYRNPWKDKTSPKEILVETKDLHLIYKSEERCEFIVSSDIHGSTLYRYFIAVKENKEWKLLRNFGINDASLLVAGKLTEIGLW